jgi:RNA polymerase sigma-B factor
MGMRTMHAQELRTHTPSAFPPPPSAFPRPPAAGRRVPRAMRERALLERYARLRDPRTRAVLVEQFLPLAYSVARRYESSNEPLDDLVQVASLGLVKAIDRFDPSRGYAFTSFAVPTIIGELKRHFRDRTWLVRPPRDLQELVLRLDRAASDMSQELDRQPTVPELASMLEADEERVLDALRARRGRSALSLQAPSANVESGPRLEDELGEQDGGFERAEARGTLDGMLTLLPPRSREVLRLRFQEDMTQAEIGRVLGVSQMQVSRIIRGGIARLREIADQQGRRADAHRRANVA